MFFFKSHCQQLIKQIAKVNIKIRVVNIKLNKEAIWWLEIWLDSQLNFTLYVNEKVKKAQIAKNQMKKLTQIYELASALVKKKFK